MANLPSRVLLGMMLGLSACRGFVGEAFLNRQAHLAVHVITSDGRTGVPCSVTALLFGQEDARADVAAGTTAQVTIGMLTPVRASKPVKARVALRVACEGYGTVTTPDRETEFAVVNVPSVEFGSVVVPAK